MSLNELPSVVETHVLHAEFIETELFTPEKLKKTLKNKTPTDGLLLTSLFFAQNPCS